MPSWRSYMKVSMSRTIGYSMCRVELAKRGTGPMSIIWCTAGVSGIDAPAIRAIAGLQTPQAITTTLGLDVAAGGAHAAHAAVLDVDAEHLGVRRDRQRARLDRALAHDRARPQRVDHAHARATGSRP